MSRDVEVLAEGLGHPEGPYELDDGRVVFAHTYRSEVSVWDHERGVRTYGHTGGGPNACMLGGDGYVYVTLHDLVGDWVPEERRTPAIVRVDPDGMVETLCTEIDGLTLTAPNDLTFGSDGTLYFTDSGFWDPESRADPGYIFALTADGRGSLLAETGNVYPNGIVSEEGGSIVWVETYTRAVRRWSPDGTVSELAILPEGHLPDGLKVAENGDLWITTITSGGVDVLGADGSLRDFIDVDGTPLNCTFGSDGGLYVCDAGRPEQGDLFSGRLIRVNVGVAGMPLFRGEVIRP